MKKYLKNPYILGIVLLISFYIFTFIFNLILLKYLKINQSSSLGVMFLGAWYLGEIYSKYYQEVISKIMRLKVSATFSLLSLSLSVLSFIFTKDYKFIQVPIYFSLLFLVLGTIVNFFFIYWISGVGGKYYLYKHPKKLSTKKSDSGFLLQSDFLRLFLYCIISITCVILIQVFIEKIKFYHIDFYSKYPLSVLYGSLFLTYIGMAFFIFLFFNNMKKKFQNILMYYSFNTLYWIIIFVITYIHRLFFLSRYYGLRYSILWDLIYVIFIPTLYSFYFIKYKNLKLF